MSSAAAILSQGVGYAVVLGIGIFFSIVMVGLTKVQSRYTKFDPKTASEFASASHSVKPGLIASGIVVSSMAPAVLDALVNPRPPECLDLERYTARE